MRREQATSQTLREQLDATYIDLKKVVEEKRRLFTRMSKYTLQQEEKDSFLAHQRGVDEQRILDASRTLSSSPLRQGASVAASTEAGRDRRDDPTAAVRKAEFSSQEDARRVTVPSGLQSDYLTDAYAAPPTVPRPVSPYLREVATSARTSTESTSTEPLATTSHLKAELTQLDGEIGTYYLHFP